MSAFTQAQVVPKSVPLFWHFLTTICPDFVPNAVIVVVPVFLTMTRVRGHSAVTSTVQRDGCTKGDDLTERWR